MLHPAYIYKRLQEIQGKIRQNRIEEALEDIEDLKERLAVGSITTGEQI